MKKVFLKNHVKLVGVKRFDGANRLIDYYIEQPGTLRIYAFTKAFTNHTYDLCKSGVRVNELLTKRSKDHGMMRLVNYMKVIMPYLAEYYNLQLQVN